MIKLIAFDLDGVLVDSSEMHFTALNMALESVDPKMVITESENMSTYDDKTTSEKLRLLKENKGLSEDKHNEIWKRKQEKTLELVNKISVDEKKVNIFNKLKDRGYMIHVCSNSVKNTVRKILSRKGLMPFIDQIYANDDVKNPKPHPEIYLKSMVYAGVKPSEVLVIEDSYVGIRAAVDSGAHIFLVENEGCVTLSEILNIIESINNQEEQDD